VQSTKQEFSSSYLPLLVAKKILKINKIKKSLEEDEPNLFELAMHLKILKNIEKKEFRQSLVLTILTSLVSID
jgi:hypothetical protein